ncbi:MAG: glycosyltransferase [Sphingomonadales bacterium]|nr:glycosyltransferase [Sphingomonadales bacterium]
MTSPIFFDRTGKRRRLVGRLSTALLALIVLAAIIFAATVVEVPAASPLALARERQQPLPFLTHVAHLRHKLPSLPKAATNGQPLRIGFYVPWDGESAASLRRHFDQLDTVISAQGAISFPSGTLTVAPDPQLAAILRSQIHRPDMKLMIQNLVNEQWDGKSMAALLANPHSADALVDQAIAVAKQGNWSGLVFDIEDLPDPAVGRYLALLQRAHPRFARAGLRVSITVPASGNAWNMRAFAAAVDSVILMDYDLHWQGGEAGPIAPAEWFTQQLAHAATMIPTSKLIVAIGSYGYDWHDGKAESMTINEAWLAARDSGTTPQFDPASGNTGFAYVDSDETGDHRHTVWMLDAATTWNELQVLKGIKGIALWRLGSEDPGFWDALEASRTGRRPNLDPIAPAQGTDVEGNGEILRITSTPTGGHRTVRFGQDGQAIGVTYDTMPTPYVVQRSGAADPHLVALTFDDGPDPDFTPRILDALESRHAPATFFVIGENALENPSLLKRMIADGDEIGNHSYTHPNLAEESRLGTALELNATRRLVEAYTGRSMRLFRAPYFGDAEPTTADELNPALIAQERGYTIVGLHVDPGDWKRPGAQAIVDQTMAALRNATPERSANIILLHDGGGDRDQTAAALPALIDQIRAAGYTIVPVSRLAGLTRDAVMPPVTGSQSLAVRADVGVFSALAAIGLALRWTFFFAIALGIARAVLMTILALVDRSNRKSPDAPATAPTVSVIIPAYNEEKVIVASVARVLASDYPGIELIVADDGSADRTSALVSEHYGKDPRVTLLTLVNGGKASALNRSLARARGEIVIALDADTQFLPDTISKLVRWFSDPRIGAVAGNARVGNRINLVTKWQAIEYVTAQNVERRALDSLGAITVVPGAVGAWRRSALDAVGGYPEDTLAEDQDLTIAIQRRGWRVAYDVEAVALTEAPSTFRALAKQRYRWSFGTLQCLWKHRSVLRKGRPRGLAWFGMPQAWVFQIIFAAISPLIDLALLLSIIGTGVRIHQHGWAQTQSDVLRMGIYWIAFVSIDLIAGWVAYRLEPTRQRFPAGLMLMQRIVYRQLMYSVVIRSISAAMRGKMVGWGKLERTGTVAIDGG